MTTPEFYYLFAYKMSSLLIIQCFVNLRQYLDIIMVETIKTITLHDAFAVVRRAPHEFKIACLEVRYLVYLFYLLKSLIFTKTVYFSLDLVLYVPFKTTQMFYVF